MTGTVLKWTNPTGHTNSAAAYTQAEQAGYVVRIDGTQLVTLPVTWGTSFDLSTLPEFAALQAGDHRAELAVKNTKGQLSAYAPAVTFSVSAIPNAPGNVSVS